jgi:hypothetical protein
MAARVALEFAKASMRLARPIFDADGRLVAGAGTLLGPRVVGVLRTMAVQSVPVVEADVEPWETVEPLADELAALAARFAGAPESSGLTALHEAIARRLATRAARFAAEHEADDENAARPAPAAEVRRG